MQLTARAGAGSLRARLGAAACLLLASGTGTGANADATTPLSPAQPGGAGTTQLDATALLYGEQNRAYVLEPTGRITRLFANGQSLSAQFAIDAMTGASPTGGVPSGQTVTTTSASGSSSSSATQVPTAKFSDLRGAVDLDYALPIGFLTPSLGGHYSRERDYESRGWNGKLATLLFHKRTTLTLGGGVNSDRVFPVGGTPVGLADSTRPILSTERQPKHVQTLLVGLSQILSRRAMASLNVSRTDERGYLTEPYKEVSLLDPITGLPATWVTEKRPTTRVRNDVLVSSVYHFEDDVLYLGYRYYWDDWRVHSNTFDVRYRRELGDQTWLEPHIRVYSQTAADFYHFALFQNAPLPEFASADYRLGKLVTFTIGGTYGFRLPDQPGEFQLRGEYIGQFPDAHPPEAIGQLSQFDVAPGINIFSITAGYSVAF